MTVSPVEIYSVDLFDDKRIKNWKECGQIGRGLEVLFWHFAEETEKITKNFNQPNRLSFLPSVGQSRI